MPEQVVAELQRLRQEQEEMRNQLAVLKKATWHLREMQQSWRGSKRDMAETMQSIADTREPNSLADTRGIGKPLVFEITSSKNLERNAKLESFVVCAFGEPVTRVLEWAVERNDEIRGSEWTGAFGPDVEQKDCRIEGLNDRVTNFTHFGSS